jgi:citrate synthase
MPDTARLEVDGKSYDLKIITGTEGERALDVGDLRQQTGLITLDPGYKNTGSCESDITFIDGEAGILHYRGYPIEELAEHSTFLEVAYLLIHGELPTRARYKEWTDIITVHTMLHEDFRRFYGAFPKDAHPMAVCAAVVSALSTFYSDALDPLNPDEVNINIIRLLAKFPTIAAYAHKYSLGQPFLYPDNRLSYIDNYLRLTFSTPCEEFVADPVIARAMDVLLILHADHEQNCSTSTVRLVGSAHANIFATISAGMAALWGPRHGGANQEVIEMLESIAEEGLTAREFVRRAKDRNETSRLMGFGHRVYKSFDPRAAIIKKQADDVLGKLGVTTKLLEIAVELEQIALSDDYFKERRLYPNVDFYSGIIFKALGIPVKSFTALFAMGRLPGWIAHWLEMHKQKQAIGRPRQVYIGPTKRSYVPLRKR